MQNIVDAGHTNKMIWASDANHVQGKLVEALKESFEDMVATGMSDEERCQSIAGLSRIVFGLSEADTDSDIDDEGDGPDSTTSGVASLCHWVSFASGAVSFGVGMVGKIL